MSTDGYTDRDQKNYDEWLAPERGSINKHSPDYDPIAASMSRHPKLTTEAAERMACTLGFGN